ncbi:DUF5431 family protein [Klebsiella pneumoniae]|nr:DUF5431 family protein [Klebsiella pneumoniae]
MPRQHQDSLLDAARQGEEGHETAAKHSALLQIVGGDKLIIPFC